MSLYDVLGVNAEATQEDFRKAFRGLAVRRAAIDIYSRISANEQLKHHPDKQTKDASPEHFNRVRHAYDVLSSVKTRESYDYEVKRAKERREKGLPPEEGRPKYDDATSSSASEVVPDPEMAFAIGLVAMAAIIFQHALLCIFSVSSVLWINAALVLVSIVGAFLTAELAIPVAALLCALTSLLAYWIMWFFAFRLLGISQSVSLIAGVVWQGSVAIAWKVGLPSNLALSFSGMTLAAQLIICFLPWYEELPLVAIGGFIMLRIGQTDRLADWALFYSSFKILHHLFSLIRFVYWLTSSLLRVVLWVAGLLIVCRLLIFAYSRSGKPTWARGFRRRLARTLAILIRRILPADILAEAMQQEEGNDTNASPTSEAGGRRHKSKKKQRRNSAKALGDEQREKPGNPS